MSFKRILKTPTSTTNIGVFLELGVLPIKYEIHKRQLGFLHHIIALKRNDPVKRMFEEQSKLPYENNWGNMIRKLLERYDLMNDRVFMEIENMSKLKWKRIVNEAVRSKALLELTSQNQSKSKTKELIYTKLEQQPYLQKYEAKVAISIFRYRIKSVACKR